MADGFQCTNIEINDLYELIDDIPSKEWELEILQGRLQENGNPIAFPKTSIFNNSWDEWK